MWSVDQFGNLVDKNWAVDATTPLKILNTDGALGHKAGTDKKEATIAIETACLKVNISTKYLTLDKGTIRKNKSTGLTVALRIARAAKADHRVSSAMLLQTGSGRRYDDKIKSFVSVKADAKAGNVLLKHIRQKSGESRCTLS